MVKRASRKKKSRLKSTKKKSRAVRKRPQGKSEGREVSASAFLQSRTLAVGTGQTLAAMPLEATVAKPGCLPLPDAENLVFRCGSPESNGVPSSTPIGNLFHGGRLSAFCQCVKNGVPSPQPAIPCSATTTLQEVINAIACK